MIWINRIAGLIIVGFGLVSLMSILDKAMVTQ